MSSTLTDAQAIEQVDSTSPYPPEPPRRSRVVSSIMTIAERRHAEHETPHLSGGSGAEKVEYEYAGAQDFWDRIGHITPIDVLEDRDVLDVGCGWGGKDIYWVERAAPRSVTGFDIPGFDP